MIEQEGMPPFQSLRVFEAAARLGSFARAAEELGVSAGAVSQHIRAIEDFAGQPLFRRLGRGVELTEAGHAAFEHASVAISESLQAGRAMRVRFRARRVSVSVAPSFASKWLLPRLGEFQTMHPDADVRMSADMNLADFAGGELDFAIRYGPGGYEGLHHERLMSEMVVVAGSPGLLNRMAIASATDLISAPLIHDDSEDRDPACPTWAMWFAARGLRHADAERGLRFNQSSLALEAAAAGKGFVLAKKQLAGDDIDAGRLVTPLDREATPVSFAYWLVWPRGRRFEPTQRAFIDWLRAGTSAAESELGGGI